MKYTQIISDEQYLQYSKKLWELTKLKIAFDEVEILEALIDAWEVKNIKQVT